MRLKLPIGAKLDDALNEIWYWVKCSLEDIEPPLNREQHSRVIEICSEAISDTLKLSPEELKKK